MGEANMAAPPPRWGMVGVPSRDRGALPEYVKSFQKFRSVPEIFEFFEKFFYYR